MIHMREVFSKTCCKLRTDFLIHTFLEKKTKLKINQRLCYLNYSKRLSSNILKTREG